MAQCYQYILCNRLVVMFPLVVSVLCWSLWSVGQSVLVKRKHSDSTHTSTQCQHKLRHNISCSSFANCENICIIFWTTIKYLSVKTSLIFYPVADCSQSYVTIPSTKKKKKKLCWFSKGGNIAWRELELNVLITGGDLINDHQEGVLSYNTDWFKSLTYLWCFVSCNAFLSWNYLLCQTAYLYKDIERCALKEWT